MCSMSNVALIQEKLFSCIFYDINAEKDIVPYMIKS